MCTTNAHVSASYAIKHHSQTSVALLLSLYCIHVLIGTDRLCLD